ncbi:peptide ABC transporter substrate-binding protein [Devosia yakushimensis]|uniref:Peptide ABC transporter substrate-binding protein n=1 Tax=Devosia yakushimensis TaxID=470028 RepID=A0ABQ5UH11_9HYPH|nr:ABC transporter substrate-binding protein [Devosia yakushimensis]GLQ11359.1 peptide ABC transporter substrate-binding protein [Devosia yakushimensis]
MNSKRWITALAAGILCTTGLSGLAWAFQEAPMLAEQVQAGSLPPVDERLPTKPAVVTAIEVGQYGGTWRRAFNGPGDRWGPTKLMEERVLKWTADANGGAVLTPGYIESYSVNENSTEFTFTLLEGLKWSDGQPVTTEDVAFWYNDIFLNRKIVPTLEPTFAPGGVPLELEVVDERTFTVKFAQPYVYFLQILAKDSTGEPSLDRPSFLFPKHYLSQFNNNYASEDELTAAAKKFNVAAWTDLWGSKGAATAWWSNPDLPVITAWKIETPPPADTVVMVRNPYYYAVDQEGNQLPYIDRIEHRLFQDPETLNLMVAQGQLDMQDRHLSLANYTFYKENEARGGYHTVNWKDTNIWSLVPNMTVKDETLAALFADAKVREAFSVAVDRELIIELTQSGLAQPVQAAPVSGSQYYNEELASHWTEYDPDLANQLLDEAGLDKRDDAGFRLRPDGKRFSLVVETSDAAHAKTLELLTENYAEVGIEMLPRVIDRTQWDNNRANNDFQMHWIPFDRMTYVPADPRRLMGWDSFGNEYFKWYSTDGAEGIEPPADDPIREIWALWDKASQSASVEEADVSVNEMARIFGEQGWVIGVYGEGPVVNIVSNAMHNVQPDLVQDDIFRGVGLARTQQFWLEQN